MSSRRLGPLLTVALAGLCTLPALVGSPAATAQEPAAAARPARPELLAPGTPAPEFTVPAYGTDKPLKLSDYKGKVVVLDFWATWCGPCMRSMPHLEKVTKGLKNQDVVVIALCTSDTKEAYEKWVAENKNKYSFTFAYDPAGRDPAKKAEKISSTRYSVSGIPTTYVIGKDGKVVEGVLGFRGDDDTRIAQALAKAGVKTADKPAAAAE